MSKIINHIAWRVFTILILLILLTVFILFFFIDWDFNQVTDWLLNFLKWFIPSLILVFITYKTFIEKLMLSHGRKDTGRILVEEIPDSAQKDGKKRSGKDASTTGEAILTREYLQRKYKKELKELIEKLYVYDFNKIDNYLNLNHSKYYVSTKRKMLEIFSQAIKENEAFIHKYWVKNGINPKEHHNMWKFRKGKYVPDVPFIDGITPGGKHMLDLLFRYFMVYIRYHFIPNYIIANQPIIEDFAVKKDGKIETLYAKVLSQDYFKLKDKDSPIPFIMGCFIAETETAIVLSNTDSVLEQEIKNSSGIREFHTVFGHLFKEEAIIRGVTQSKERTNKTLRELYEAYLHMFKFEFKATSDFRRSIIKTRRGLAKFKLFRLKITNRLLRVKFIKRKHMSKIQKTRKKISKLHQRDLKLWSKGYIVFYIGVYDKIEDSGKVVKFPLMWGLRNNKKNSEYNMQGFKQINKITDCFGRYETHFMETVKEAKNTLTDMHWNDVPNWTGLSMTPEQIKFMNYRIFNDLIFALINSLKEEEKERKKTLRKKQQERLSQETPNFNALSNIEVLNLCSDWGIEVNYTQDILMKMKSKYIHNEKDLIDIILSTRENFIMKLANMYIDYYNNVGKHKNSWGMY